MRVVYPRTHGIARARLLASPPGGARRRSGIRAAPVIDIGLTVGHIPDGTGPRLVSFEFACAPAVGAYSARLRRAVQCGLGRAARVPPGGIVTGGSRRRRSRAFGTRSGR